MEEKGREPLEAFNRLYKQMDECYHAYARSQGLSDAAFWLLYCLNESGPCTQRELCAAWSYPPQTINSALKTDMKKANIAIENNAADKAEAVRVAIKKIDQAVAKGLLHKNTAARRKSSLAKRAQA